MNHRHSMKVRMQSNSQTRLKVFMSWRMACLLTQVTYLIAKKIPTSQLKELPRHLSSTDRWHFKDNYQSNGQIWDSYRPNKRNISQGKSQISNKTKRIKKLASNFQTWQIMRKKSDFCTWSLEWESLFLLASMWQDLDFQYRLKTIINWKNGQIESQSNPSQMVHIQKHTICLSLLKLYGDASLAHFCGLIWWLLHTSSFGLILV